MCVLIYHTISKYHVSTIASFIAKVSPKHTHSRSVTCSFEVNIALWLNKPGAVHISQHYACFQGEVPA